MKQRLAVLTLIPAAFVLSSCAQLEESASGIASDAASQFAEATADELRGQACRLVEDGTVSLADQQFLSEMVESAATAGLPAEFTEPLSEIAAAGDDVPRDSVESLQNSCAKT
ncbi:hypothetical protein IWX64_001021 [Arthrobacter sp. CAN_A212]|uniref:hypothetical protein n=1 Tax=unclassified Arthrobacter TaxID=235627 RepID=UPI0018CB1CBB|nr:hypothetical protein [Arthrobacter sp. CAN_C5]MBP2218185.1 hypothetical protein [Arthrobacter sp. CAN_C5]